MWKFYCNIKGTNLYQSNFSTLYSLYTNFVYVYIKEIVEDVKNLVQETSLFLLKN